MLNFGNKEFRNLQEQVLKNAQDIEASEEAIAVLQSLPRMEVVVLEELPETGEAGYIYLVPKDGGEDPDIYEEYIWVTSTSSFEYVGNTDVDLSNYVDLTSNQTISGAKSFNGATTVNNTLTIHGDAIIDGGDLSIQTYGDSISFNTSSPEMRIYKEQIEGLTDPTLTLLNEDAKLRVYTTCVRTGDTYPLDYTSNVLGSSSEPWHDIYVGDKVSFVDPSEQGDTFSLTYSGSSNLSLYQNNTARVNFGDETYFNTHVIPFAGSSFDLGTNGRYWRKLYTQGIQFGNNATFTINGPAVALNRDFVPAANQSYNLGSQYYRYNRVYTNGLYDGNNRGISTSTIINAFYSNADINNWTLDGMDLGCDLTVPVPFYSGYLELVFSFLDGDEAYHEMDPIKLLFTPNGIDGLGRPLVTISVENPDPQKVNVTISNFDNSTGQFTVVADVQPYCDDAGVTSISDIDDIYYNDIVFYKFIIA